MQDLEKQLSHARQQLSHMRTAISDTSPTEGRFDRNRPGWLRLPHLGSHPQRRQRPSLTTDVSRVRANLRDYSRDLFDVPWPGHQPEPQRSSLSDVPELPPKHIGDLLLSRYYASIHTTMPVLHWPTFTEIYENAYQRRTLRDVTPIWASLLFSVFACGALFTADHSVDRHRDGKAYLEVSRSMADLWENEFSLDHVRAGLLTSIALNEMNLRSASRVCLGSCIRAAHELGLHCDAGRWPVIESEMRRRVWWGVYSWDR